MIPAAAWRRCAIAFLTGRAQKTAKRRARSFAVPTNERLEPKLVMSAMAATPAIQMLSATTTDSKSVTIQYQVNEAPGPTSPIQIGLYRSSNRSVRLERLACRPSHARRLRLDVRTARHHARPERSTRRGSGHARGDDSPPAGLAAIPGEAVSCSPWLTPARRRQQLTPRKPRHFACTRSAS